MKVLIIAVLFLFSFSLFALETEVGGFIALDLLKVNEIKLEGGATYNSGVGAIDLKIYARKGDFSSKIKLDLDDGSVGKDYNIFEEVTVSYKFSNMLLLKAGKGKVKFSRQHRGTIEGSYIDGGSLLGTDISWRDQDNAALTSIRIGNKEKGFFNYFTLYGEKYNLYKEDDGSIDSGPDKVYNIKTEHGFANYFEFFPMKNLRTSIAGILYKNDFDRQDDWAISIGGEYSDTAIDVWFEYQHGYTSNYDEAYHGSIKNRENVFQIGAEYVQNDFINWIIDIESAMTKNHKNSYDYHSDDVKDKHVDQQNYKIEFGPKFKMNRSAFFTVGGLYEIKRWEIEEVKQPTDSAWQMATTFSYWF